MLIHRRLAALARVCWNAKWGESWYAMSGVRVHRLKGSTQPNMVRAEATDGRRLIRAEWQDTGAEAEELPDVFEGPQNTIDEGFDVIVPGKLWAAIGKLVKLGATTKPVLENVVLDEFPNNGTVKFGATDLEETVTRRGRAVEGEFPQTDAVWPKTEAQAKSCMLDARMLADTLKAMADASDGMADCKLVELHFHGEDEPLELRMVETRGAVVSGLQMPMNV